MKPRSLVPMIVVLVLLAAGRLVGLLQEKLRDVAIRRGLGRGEDDGRDQEEDGEKTNYPAHGMDPRTDSPGPF